MSVQPSSHSSKENVASLSSAISVEKLQQSIRDALNSSRDIEEVLTFIGENNGWGVEDLLDEPQKITKLELFLVNIKKIPEIRFFPFLTVIKFQHVGLTSMAEFKPLVSLEELWLSHNEIKQIEGLEGMAKLRKLFINGNHLTSMEGLPVLKHLRELWLSQNEISTISHLENVRKVRTLVLACNPISSLEEGFGHFLQSLHSLNLAGCRIYSFHHVSFLSVLPCLRSFWLSDPLFGDNGICRLNNYTTFTLHVLGSLEMLDYIPVTPEQRTLADSIYSKKRVYYSMRIHTLDRNFSMLSQHAQFLADEKVNRARSIRRHLMHHLNDIQNELAERTAYGKGSVFDPEPIFPTSKLEEVKRLLQHAVGTREVELRNISKRLAEAVTLSRNMTQQLKQQLCVELNTGGNIRLDEVSPKDSWSESAHELVFARFKPENYKKYGINGVQINRVFRVLNRGLRLRFDDRVKEMDIDLSNSHNRKSLLCLFSVVPTTRAGEDALLQYMMVYGMDNPSPPWKKDSVLHTLLPSPSEGVPLTNSILVADEERLNACLKSGQISGVNSNPNALTARLFVFRVLLGKSVTALGGTGSRDEVSTFMRGGKKVIRKDYGSDVFSVYRTHPEDSNVRVWYCFDRTLVLPELLIDFSYVTTSPLTVAPAVKLLSSPEVIRKYFENVIGNSSGSDSNDVQNACYYLAAFMKWCEPGPFDQFAKEESDKALQKGGALLALVSRGETGSGSGKSGVLKKGSSSNGVGSSETLGYGGTLSKDSFTHYAATVNCDPVSLSFCGLALKNFTSITQELSEVTYPLLSILDLSRNKITHCSWFSVATTFPNLKHFNLSDNELMTLDLQMCVMPQIQTLDVSYNKLTDLNEVQAIPASFPKLQRLSINNNPMMAKKNTECIALSYFVDTDLIRLNDIDLMNTMCLPIPCLLKKRSFDFRNTPKNEPSMALKYILRVAYQNRRFSSGSVGSSSSQMSAGTVWNLVSVDNEVVSEHFFEEAIRQVEDLEPRKRTSTMVVAIHEAESACDDGGNEAFFASIPSIQYSKSCMRKMDWVEWLPNLRHLILQSHNIADITPALQLGQLEILDVQDNCLGTIPDLSSLPHLQKLNISFNQLPSIDAIGVIPQLRCLNASGNLIEALDEGLFAQFSKLEEFFLAKNKLTNKNDFRCLKDLPQLISVDLTGNPMLSVDKSSSELKETRYFFIYHFPHIKVLDGQPVSQSESQKARDVYAGKLSSTLLAERAGVQKKAWETVKELDLSHCFFREITNLLDSFIRLEILRLDYNLLNRIDGLSALRALRVLNLSHNKLGAGPSAAIGSVTHNLPLLESLSLEANQLSDIATLRLDLPRLKFLNLKNNEIQRLDKALVRLPELREIILDQNKLRGFGSECFASCQYLTEISAEDNSIRVTEGLRNLQNLEGLNLSSNHLAEQNQFFADLRGCQLTHLSVFANPMSRKTRSRITFIAQFPTLKMLDGKPISVEEREKALNIHSVELVSPPNVVMDMNFGGVTGSADRIPADSLENSDPQQQRSVHSLPSAQVRLQPMSLTFSNGKAGLQNPSRRSLNMTRGRDRF